MLLVDVDWWTLLVDVVGGCCLVDLVGGTLFGGSCWRL